MDKFLERQKLPMLTQEETDNLKISISTKEVKFYLKCAPISTHTHKHTSLHLDGITGKL